MTQKHGRMEDDVPFNVNPGHIEEGVKQSKVSCSLQRSLPEALGTNEVTVSVDDSDDDALIPYAVWELFDVNAKRIRVYNGEIEPRELAVKVITQTDTDRKARLLHSWPAEGREFCIVDVRSRLRPPTSVSLTSSPSKPKNPTPKVSVTKRKARRTSVRIGATTGTKEQ